MRIESVTAHGFGPLVEQTLRLAPGMTVVAGANESAKSSWHAAIYAALCGRKRGRGRATGPDQRFADLHRPWDGGPWLVSAVVSLEDGRRVEMRQDLDARVDCSATDLATGRDVSGEVLDEGTPDAARWLGLDRRSFLATACVNQAQVLGILDEPGALASLLERAAATAGADATATEAIGRLEAFRAEHVGRGDPRSSRPLRNALAGLDRARQDLDEARAAHGEYLEALAAAEELRRSAEEAGDRVARCEATLARDQADELRVRYERAVGLDKWLAGVEPARPSQADERSTMVARALEALRGRRQPVELDGPSAAELAARLAELPSALVAFPPGIEVAEVLELAGALEQQPPPTAPGVTGRLEDLARRARELRAAERRSRRLVAVGLALVLGGVVGAAFGPRVVGALALVGALLAAAGALAHKRRGLATIEADLSELQARDARAREAAERVGTAQSHARARCAELGLPQDPGELRALPGQLLQRSALEAQLRERQRTEEMAATAAVARLEAETQVREAARTCGLAPGPLDQVVAGLHEWEQRRREDLEDLEARQSTASELEALLGGRSLEELAEQLARAERERDRTAVLAHLAPRQISVSPGRDTAHAGELDVAPDGSPVLAGEIDVTRARGLTLAGEIGPPAGSGTASDLAAWREQAAAARAELARAQGALSEQIRALRSVAAAEEALGRAEAELARVRSLDETLQATIQLLERAQQGVQRDVAPVLASSLQRWLPRVTSGRYSDATVDPTTLEVRVCGPSRRWRSAEWLSRGTAEQVYLLLRVTLARHLASDHEVCPLLLDDVTVQSDAARTARTLELLHELSSDQQVVVFTQERSIAAWAVQHLRRPTDAVVELPVVGVR